MTNPVLTKIAPPALPHATPDYNSPYQDQLNNVHRLFYNRLVNVLNALVDKFLSNNPPGGASLYFPYGAFHEDGVTTLTTGISNVSTTPIVVGSTADFPASGWILIESEIIAYTGKTSTTFTGITRGVLGTTNVAHSSGVDISEVQGTGSPSTIGNVLFNATDYSNGVSVSVADSSKIYFDYAGIYNLQISAQCLNFTSAEDNITMWFALNGSNLPYTASIEQVNSKHGSSPGAAILTFNILQQVASGDYIQVKWASDSGNSVVATYPAGVSPVHPVSPAIILTATFVSAV